MALTMTDGLRFFCLFCSRVITRAYGLLLVCMPNAFCLTIKALCENIIGLNRMVHDPVACFVVVLVFGCAHPVYGSAH